MSNLSLPLNRTLRLTLMVALTVLMPFSVSAWSRKGHAVIAGLAWGHLNHDTKVKVAGLLGQRSLDREILMAVAMWSDEQLETRKWHFVEIPLEVDEYSQERDCPNRDCLVEKIEDFKRELQFGTNRQKRVEALKHLVHLVGDLHQPLHCADNNDAGANRVQVTFFGNITNLHKLWDLDMLERSGLDDAGYIDRLGKMEVQRGYWIARWAHESHMIARKYAYKIPPDKQLSNSYYRLNLPILESQLAKAGVRLAQVLEDALAPLPKSQRKALVRSLAAGRSGHTGL